MPNAPLIAGVEVKVGGTELPADALLEVRVEQHLFMPDTFSFRLSDPMLQHVDDARFAPGADVEISAAGPEQLAPIPLIVAKIAAVEPEFGRGSAALTVRGYDLSHALNRFRRTQAFQNMTVADIARKTAQQAGLKLGKVGPTGGPLDFVQQSNETDWDFLWRLARAIDFVLCMEGRTLQFRSAATPAAGPPVQLVWGEGLLQLRPRVTGVHQVDEVKVNGWDVKAKQVITAQTRVAGRDGAIGLTREKAAARAGGGKVAVTDQPVGTQMEAKSLAESTASRLGNAYLEADGVALGDARIRAGARLTIDGVGTRFGGTYLVSSAHHVYRSAQGYETRFAVSGRSTRTLLDLMSPPARRPWGEGLVVGVATNNNDPDGLGRVRVKYPTLDDTLESWWARIAVPSAGMGRGVLMLPIAGDEVVIGFEHGDPRRPYVLGAVFNGRAKPLTLAHPDGSLHVHSDKQMVLESIGNITVDGKANLDTKIMGNRTEQVTGMSTTKATGKMDVQATGPLTIEGKSMTAVKAGAMMSVEATGLMTIKANGPISIESSAVVRISGAQIMLG